MKLLNILSEIIATKKPLIKFIKFDEHNEGVYELIPIKEKCEITHCENFNGSPYPCFVTFWLEKGEEKNIEDYLNKNKIKFHKRYFSDFLYIRIQNPEKYFTILK